MSDGRAAGARRPLLLGHRGARKYAPENTLEAFQLALEHGCDGFEFDLRCTADRRSVICHDAKLGGIEIAKAKFRDLRAPCLDDVFARFAATAFLDVEVKTPALDDEVLAAVASHHPQRYFVSSFVPDILLSLAARSAEIPLGYICDEGKKLPFWRDLPIRYLVPNEKLVTRELVGEAHAAGVQVHVWTVNDQRAMRKLAAFGVDGLISDDTRLLSETFAG